MMGLGGASDGARTYGGEVGRYMYVPLIRKEQICGSKLQG